MVVTIDALRAECQGGAKAPAYIAKMVHPVPVRPVVERDVFILTRCRGQVVLDIGASGPMHASVVNVATMVYGLDRLASSGVTAFDLDDVTLTELPTFPDVTRVLCGEVLEHLSNPGHLLARLRRQYACPLIVSVPNAFGACAAAKIAQGIEHVNRDHIAWYSPKTLEWLLARYGYTIHEWAWYNGRPYTAEGLVALAEAA